ncbi:putative pre-mRNA splicing factor prp1 [Ceraceosorus guamensis]|uniref:Putative pre-mRNA splicing factor prp1 n=1 Tax=Ceraceosorus guamensis TaxID=1522189 RepID=A0A316W3K6_9BASI|nr:putative pre-mRNA splicing factor prp1 [Ceraceosorus guamensis]PWN42155.1 putative pre-mRNA splicing factor prp1 [Ceraceosorus guamensis]
MASVNNKLAFLTQAPPPNYVAGLGRGASGFTTRSDIGPAREGPSLETINAARARRGEETLQEEDTNEDQDPENETGLFAGTVYERDDEEADSIWANIDDKMDARRRKQREAREKAELEKLRIERPKIQAQFADLKRNLSTMSDDDWSALPEAGNLTGKRRKAAAARAGNDKTYNVPDSVLLMNRDRNMTEQALSEEQMNSNGTSSTLNGAMTSLTEIGEARNKIFSHNLDQAGSSSRTSDGTQSTLGTASSIDTQGYLTGLAGTEIKSSAEIGDIKKARALLDSVIKTNPKHAPGWIAAARLEEVAGKMVTARKVIAQGCEQCKLSEDVWLESARLNTRDNAKVILAKSIAAGLTTSVKIWLKATELETDSNSKKRVLRKSLEYVPNSIKLWKELVNLEESHEDARILLSGAVTAVPGSVDLWLAFARLSSPEEAQKVLNEARKALPSSHEIWIAAARLIEQTNADQGKPVDETQTLLDRTLSTAVKRLQKAGAVLSRDQWLKEAERVEREGSPMSCAAIVKATITIDVEEEDRRTVWVEDAQACLEHGNVETARAILAFTLREYPDRQSIWRIAVDVERKYGTTDSLEAILERAVTMCPKAETLWLIYAKEKWQGQKDVAGARQVLIRAFEKNLGSEEISLAAAKLEAENGQKQAAAMLLQRARQEVNSQRVWLKSAVFAREEGQLADSLDLVKQAIKVFPSFWKLHLMHAQLVEVTTPPGTDNAHLRAAREALSAGLRACPSSTPLWINASRLEERAGLSIRARALLEKARLSKAEDKVSIWVEAARVEERSGNAPQAKALIARGLQEYPNAAALWSADIWLESRAARRTRSADALNKTDQDAQILGTIARMMWNDRKYEQARKWFERCTKANPDWGDGWAWWYKFETAQGTEESRLAVRERCKKAEPRHGEQWQQQNKDPNFPHRPTAEVLEATAKTLVITT